MKKWIGLCPMLWLVLESTGYSQDIAAAWVQVPDSRTQDMVRTLGLGFVEQQDGDWLLFHGHPQSMRRLEESGLSWKPGRVMLGASTEGYHDASAMQDALEGLVAENPGLVQWVSLGESREGRLLLALRISATEHPAVEWRILGAHHGDELSSAEVALGTAFDLVEGYIDDPTIQDLLERDAVWVVPHVNPDGVERQWRYNSIGVDLNRNYEYQWSASEWGAGASPFSEPETQALRTLGDWTGTGAGLSIHSGAINLGWPWNYDTDPPPDGDLLQALAQDYADLCGVEDFWITNGASWYITHGDTNDWSYGRHGILDYTLEVSEDKTPPASELADILSDHGEAILAFMTEPVILAGQVIDAESGQGIPATLTLEGSAALQTGPDGRFGRPVADGVLSVEVTAPGHQSHTLEVESGQTGLTIELDREALRSIRPTPALLSRSGEGWFGLDKDAVEVWVTRPGHPSYQALAVDEGWVVPIDEMSPGPWTLDVDGEISPRSLFIGERDGRVEITGVSLKDDVLAVSGTGFGVGSQAWALSGPLRALSPLELLHEDSKDLVFTAPDVPLDDPVDLIVVSHGYQLTVLDIQGSAITDTGEPGIDSGGTDSQAGGPEDGGEDSTTSLRAGELSGCACAHRGIDFPRSLLVVSLGMLLLSWRRTP